MMSSARLVPQAAVAAAAGAAAQTAAQLGASPTAVADAVAAAVHSCWRWSEPRPECRLGLAVECEVDHVGVWLAEEASAEDAAAKQEADAANEEATALHLKLVEERALHQVAGAELNEEEAQQKTLETNPSEAVGEKVLTEKAKLDQEIPKVLDEKADGGTGLAQNTAAQAKAEEASAEDDEGTAHVEATALNLKRVQEHKQHHVEEAGYNWESAQQKTLQKKPGTDLKGDEGARAKRLDGSRCGRQARKLKPQTSDVSTAASDADAAACLDWAELPRPPEEIGSTTAERHGSCGRLVRDLQGRRVWCLRRD